MLHRALPFITQHLALVIHRRDIVADMLQHSRFVKKELDRERQVIIQEIGGDRDAPEDYVYEVLHELSFPDQRIGRPILGSTEVIAKLPRSAISEYVKRYYRAGNMILVAAGSNNRLASPTP